MQKPEKTVIVGQEEFLNLLRTYPKVEIVTETIILPRMLHAIMIVPEGQTTGYLIDDLEEMNPVRLCEYLKEVSEILVTRKTERDE